ncbi:MAG: CehA/McbA family metallohydrolase [Candidatus Latescibacterota bacterium]|nr:CehA/McbA family metallohydrolase [Candidatus Latescibacterota bacterium]
MSDAPSGTITNPYALSDNDGYFWVRGNLHSHTTNSDGRIAPQERVEGYVKEGYGFLCLSDHYKITRVDTVQTPDDFVLIQGAELHPHNPFGGQVHHFVCLNISEDMDSQTMPPQHVIDNVNDQGGSIWLAHPHWSSVNILRDVMPLKGLTGIEVFNSICRSHGRGESSTHWDDWMEQSDRLIPCLADDDSHYVPAECIDVYQSWTMARVKESTPEAIHEALRTGATYGSTGPEIHSIEVHAAADSTSDRTVAEVIVKCSEAQRIAAVCNSQGTEYRELGKTFEEATFSLRAGARWVRIEVIGPDGSKAWSNPIDLTVL